MARRVASLFAVLSVFGFAAPATADSSALPVDIRAAPLATSLRELARQSGAELLFDRRILAGYRSPELHGRMPIGMALQRLLADTGLSTHRAGSGAWIIERQPLPGQSPTPDLDAPEILVVGRRSQDVDIRRTENDIQPRQVATGEQIVRAHRDNLDQYFQSRVTPNTTVSPPSLGTAGETNSKIDLRGLGTDQTLVLVDGRRMPGTAGNSLEPGQADINAIPLHAIERIETLTGTAGGIYGLGALGGVVNVVLRHDQHGLELHATTGISARGDARRLDLEAGLGFTPDEGRTDVSIYGGISRQRPLAYDARNFATRARAFNERFAPDRYSAALLFDPGSARTVASESGETLVLKPQYGGASLGSDHSFIANSFDGSQTDLVASLLQHAGQADMSTTGATGRSDLTSTPRTASLIADVRHHFGGGVEAYADALILRDHGENRTTGASGLIALPADSPYNPFQNAIRVGLPGLPLESYDKVRFDSERYSGGLIVPLPLGWRANAEAIFAVSHYRRDSLLNYLDDVYAEDDPSVNPFAVTAAIQSALAAYTHRGSSKAKADSRLHEQSLRLAGPLFRTAAGPSTLTILFQNRRETVPGSSITYVDEIYFPDGAVSDYSGSSSWTRSAYGELTAPLIGRDSPIAPLRGLTVQAALRHDARKASLVVYDDDDELVEVHPHFNGTMLTAGAKLDPTSWLMLRGSYATGRQPPPLGFLETTNLVEYLEELPDPKRSDTSFADQGDYVLRYGGLDLKQVHATTMALGMVINPDGDRGPRLSLDYSHTRRTGDLTERIGAYILTHEDMFPGRVIRAPLTDADRAKGYSAGVVRFIDASGLALGRLVSDSIDARLDWRIAVSSGVLRLRGAATRQLRNLATGPLQDPEQRVGFVNGPLRWRANGGAEWTAGPMMIGVNAQYFSRYRIASSGLLFEAGYIEEPQGSRHVKAQAYVDLYASRRFHTRWAGGDHEISLDLAVVNLFDHTPPYESTPNARGAQYSFYGDPRQRRFELTLNAAL